MDAGFQLPDYVVFIGFLMILVGIGIYKLYQMATSGREPHFNFKIK